MGALSPDAARLKYEYSRKYVDRYWEKKAASKTTEATEPSKADLLPQYDPNETITINRLDCKSDEDYIKGLETANKSMRSENRRLINLLHRYQERTERIEKLCKQKI